MTAATDLKPTSSRPTVLVIDDEPDILDLLYRTLHREFRVLRADSGPAALEILTREPDIAVIVSDQRMPLMSGTEFLSLTAVQYPDIMRIIVTGYTDVEDLVEAINSGKVFKYVTKPWNDEDLKISVRKAVETHNVLRARTRELRRALRRESLLNAIATTIRSSTLDYQLMLQTVANTVGQALGADYCVVRSVRDRTLGNEIYAYRGDAVELAELDLNTLGATLWLTAEIVNLRVSEHPDVLQGHDPEVAQRRGAFAAGDIESSLVLPLRYRDEQLAVLGLHRVGISQPWDEDDAQVMAMVADQAALELAQVQAYEQIRALADREALVNSITRAIRSSLDPQQIFAAITQQVREALGCDGCALSLWTAKDEYVHCVAFNDGTQTLADASVLMTEDPSAAGPIGEMGPHCIDPISATAIQGGEPLPRSLAPISGNRALQELIATQAPVAIADLDESDWMDDEALPIQHRARALLIVPLLSDGHIIGSISLRQQQPRQWRSPEIDLVQTVAAQAAIAVQQSRLYQTTRQQAEKLLELDRQKTEFFQNISHEFRTPLTLTLGPLETAVYEGRDLPLDQVEAALRNSRRLLRLVNQLLDLQRLDAGRMQPSFRPCDLAEFAGQIIDAFRPYCDRKGITLAINLQSCPNIYIDIERFDKVLYNLLSNAMKFTEQGGTITVSTEIAGDHCLLKVRDTGIGIRADQIPHLFERFRQAEGSISRSYEGTGLGLALVRELVELHGGKISVESEYNQGSTFTIWLPQGALHLPADRTIAQPVQLEPHRASIEFADLDLDGTSPRLASPLTPAATPDSAGEGSSPPPPAPLPASTNLEVGVVLSALGPEAESTSVDASDRPLPLVLVVDDNRDLRNYVADILRRHQYRVVLARNGAEGVRSAQEHRPDLILTDLMMPVFSGLDLLREIRSDAALRGTPTILLTAKADEDTRIAGVERGADAYLSKPFSDRELLAEVRNLIALKENERQVVQLNTYLTESVLRRFLPESMVKKAAAGELSLDLQPEPRLVTILFSDIVGFTQLSNTLRSRRVAEMLDEYLSSMSRAVFDNGGTVDKFMGDAILALFGAPEDATPNEQVQRAVATARQMHESLRELNQRWGEQGIPPVQFRCGIHQGTAVVGLFGSAYRADYTAIGPCVNIAARLQEAAAPGSVLISAAVADYLDEDRITKYRPMQLKGVDETVLTFCVDLDLDLPSVTSQD